jgi:K+-transporting ATPase ATPase C chain
MLMTVLTGVFYPGVVTVVAQLAFPVQANGSVMVAGNAAVGSSQLGQSFTDPRYFRGRPSATGPQPYNGGVSSGSNQGVVNPALASAVQARIANLRAADPTNPLPVPVDLVTASASGLDPHISPAAAQYQQARVARQRGLTESAVAELIAAATEGRTLGLLGEPRVNVLQLNLALDQRAAE